MEKRWMVTFRSAIMLICLIAAPLWAVMDQGDSPPRVANVRSSESLHTKSSEAQGSDMGVDFSNAITLEKELQKEMPLRAGQNRGGQNLAGQIGSGYSGHGQFAAIPQQSQQVRNGGIDQSLLNDPNDPLSYAHPTARHVGSAQQGENAGQAILKAGFASNSNGVERTIIQGDIAMDSITTGYSDADYSKSATQIPATVAPLSIGSFPNFSAGSPAGEAGVANNPAPGIDATNPKRATRGSATTGDVARASADPFTTMARQLDRWGARHYALERLPGEVAIFRFRCSMSDPRSREGIRTFEAQASDPLSAMGEALGKVARWKASEL